MRRAFTLIELLVVVAIIAILAAIAVPNYLEAMVRAKTSRVKADLRTYSTAIESFALDHGEYPPPLGAFTWELLSSPRAYMSSSIARDVFSRESRTVEDISLHYGAANAGNRLLSITPNPPYSISTAGQRPSWYFTMSRGPDGKFGLHPADPEYNFERRFFESNFDNAAWLAITYNPTNGTISPGNIYRSGGSVGGYAGHRMNF